MAIQIIYFIYYQHNSQQAVKENDIERPSFRS